jgi:flagellar motor switch protein FliM
MSAAGVLSEDQIAALVTAARDGQLDEETAPASISRRRRVRRIDFTRPSKFTSEQQRRLERAHDSFCRSVATRLSADLRMAISVELIDTAQLTWAKALDEVPAHSVSAIVDVAPFDGRILLTAELTLLLGLLERLLGGQGGAPTQRQLTDVDRNLTKRIFQTLLDELSISFNDLADLRFGLVDLETARAPAQLAPLSEPTLAMTFEVKLERESSTMVLLIPHRAIEPVLRAPVTGGAEAALVADAATAAVTEAMSGVVVQLRAEAGAVNMPVEDVLALRPGDTLRLDGAAEEGAVTLFADNVPLQRCKLGRNGRRRAVGVLGPVEEQS